MKSSSYKDCQTSRGYGYHYYFSPPKDANQPFLVFLHGYPSTSKDWRKQVTFFESQGFGIIVPDMLGWGGTSKPLEVEAYSHSLIAQDIIDILALEKGHRAFFIGHDWGSAIASRIAQLFSSRVSGVAFLAAMYMPPAPDFNYEAALRQQKELIGRELFGYWSFFSEKEAWKLCEEKIHIFFNVLYPEDPKIWISDFSPTDALKKALLEGKSFAPPSWLTPEERQNSIDTLLSNSLQAPNLWYKYMTSGLSAKVDQTVPLEKYNLKMPVFFGAALEDYIGLASYGKMIVSKYCNNATTHEYQTNHWLMLQAPEKLNQDLLHWIDSINAQ